MSIRLVAIAALLASPLAAQNILPTHVEVQVPGGKIPTKLYKPVAQQRGCAAAGHQHHVAGKLPHAPVAAAPTCGTELAAADRAPARP